MQLRLNLKIVRWNALNCQIQPAAARNRRGINGLRLNSKSDADPETDGIIGVNGRRCTYVPG
jgi:hypothetical protein